MPAGGCDQHRRRFMGNKTTTLVEMLKPTGQLVSIKPPSSTAGLSGRVVTWGEGLLQPLQISWALFKYLSNHLFSPWCCWDAQVTSFWRPKPFLDSPYSNGGRVGPSGVPEGLGCQRRNVKSFARLWSSEDESSSFLWWLAAAVGEMSHQQSGEGLPVSWMMNQPWPIRWNLIFNGWSPISFYSKTH